MITTQPLKLSLDSVKGRTGQEPQQHQHVVRSGLVEVHLRRAPRVLLSQVQ